MENKIVRCEDLVDLFFVAFIRIPPYVLAVPTSYRPKLSPMPPQTTRLTGIDLPSRSSSLLARLDIITSSEGHTKRNFILCMCLYLVMKKEIGGHQRTSRAGHTAESTRTLVS